MKENKEFEEYSKSYSSKTQSLYDTIGAVSKFLIPDLDRFRQESYEAGQMSPSFETIKSAFAKLTPEQRVEITDDYCPYCGNKTPCNCMYDD